MGLVDHHGVITALAHRMSYQNDIFISYRRETHAWTPWARDIFKPPLEACLQRELGNPPNIFIDAQIPYGANYVNHLATTLAKSKVMVALLSKDFFSSDWCVHELDLMMERAQGADLIIPIVVHDGHVIPNAVDLLNAADFKDYAIPALSHAGPLYAQFWATLVKLAERIGNAVEAVPAFDPHWEDVFKQRLTDVHAAHAAGKRLPPNRTPIDGLRLPPSTPLK
jgi:hypothetical protein